MALSLTSMPYTLNPCAPSPLDMIPFPQPTSSTIPSAGIDSFNASTINFSRLMSDAFSNSVTFAIIQLFDVPSIGQFLPDLYIPEFLALPGAYLFGPCRHPLDPLVQGQPAVVVEHPVRFAVVRVSMHDLIPGIQMSHLRFYAKTFPH